MSRVSDLRKLLSRGYLVSVYPEGTTAVKVTRGDELGTAPATPPVMANKQIKINPDRPTVDQVAEIIETAIEPTEAVDLMLPMCQEYNHTGKRWTKRQSDKLAAKLATHFGGEWFVRLETSGSCEYVSAEVRSMENALHPYTREGGAWYNCRLQINGIQNGQPISVVDANAAQFAGRKARNAQRRKRLAERNGPMLSKVRALADAIDAYQAARALLVDALGESFDGPFSADYYNLARLAGLRED